MYFIRPAYLCLNQVLIAGAWIEGTWCGAAGGSHTNMIGACMSCSNHFLRADTRSGSLLPSIQKASISDGGGFLSSEPRMTAARPRLSLERARGGRRPQPSAPPEIECELQLTL